MMRVMAALAVFVLATGVTPTPQARVLPAVSTAAAIACDPEIDPECVPPPVDCSTNPELPECIAPCDINPTDPGCPDEPGSITINKTSDEESDQLFEFTIGDSLPAAMNIGGSGTLDGVSPGEITVDEADAPGWYIASVACFLGDSGLEVSFDNSSFTVSLPAGANINCNVDNEKTFTIDKSVTSVDPVAGEPGSYDVTYLVRVVNNSPEASDLIVQDEFLMGGSVYQGTPTATGPGDPIVLDSAWDGEGHPQLTESFTLPGKPTDPESTVNRADFTVSIPVSVNSTDEIDMCPPDNPNDNSGGFNNVARVQVGVDGPIVAVDSACAEVPRSDLTVTKSVEDEPTYDADAETWTVQYLIEVDNLGEGSADYQLSDFPEFGDRAYVTGFTVEDLQTDDTFSDSISGGGFDVTDEPVTINGGGHHSYLLTIEFNVDGGRADNDQCGKGPGRGLYNEVTLSSNNVEMSDNACADIPMSNVTYEKDVESVAYPSHNDVAVTFTVTVHNDDSQESPAWPEPYLFIDAPTPSPGIEPTDLELLSVDGAVAGEDFGSEYGVFVSEFSLGVQGYIAPGATHVFHIQVTYSVDTEGYFWGQCNDIGFDSIPGGLTNVVLYNLAYFFGPDSAQVRGVSEVDPQQELPFDFDFACVPVSQVTFDKSVTNDNGGSLNPADVVFEIKDGATVLQSGHTGDTVVVASGEYTISEQPVPGYMSSGIECTITGGGDEGDYRIALFEQSDTTTLLPDFEYLCSVINDDMPVDLAIDKSDGDATLVAGGAPVTYTLTVTNDGGFAPEGSNATVRDVLPAGLVWVPGSVTGCISVVFSGQTMTCQIPAAQLVPGATFAITVKALLPANGASGSYVNLATVDNGTAVSIAAPTCNTESKRVDCETTPAVRHAAVTATKVSDATGAKKTGDAVAYTLTVTNSGPSTLLPGTVLTDDLPDGLQFVSVSGPGWVCGNSDPVVCSSDAVVNPGASLPAVVINTKVTATGNGTLTNTGVFTAIVDTDAGAAARLLRLSATVTVQASASAVASIQLVQESAPPPVVGPLPVTGGSPLGILYAGLAALGIGAFLLRVRRLHAPR